MPSPHHAAFALLLLTLPAGALFESGAAATDSRDCRPCRKLRFCSGFLNQMAADCEGDDEEEDAEDKWENRIGASCNSQAYRQYACARKMDPCDQNGRVVPVCKATCTAAKSSCENRGTAACEGLPSTRCWDTSFDACSELTCGASNSLGLCSAMGGYNALHCDGEHDAQVELDAMVAHSHEYNFGSQRGGSRCSKAFLKAYLCHTAMRPCTAGVGQKACHADCYRFQRYCLRQPDSVALLRCSTHTSFYCDSIAQYLPRGVDPQFTHDESWGNSFLITVVLLLCLLQILVLRCLQGGTPPAASSFSVLQQTSRQD